VTASGFTFVSWWQSCCVRGRAGRPSRPRTQHGCHHESKVKPKAATAVIELLMMGGKTPETCWVVNKRHDNKLKNCCIWLVIYLIWRIIVGILNWFWTVKNRREGGRKFVVHLKYTFSRLLIFEFAYTGDWVILLRKIFVLDSYLSLPK
jgi:hypothetical protein